MSQVAISGNASGTGTLTIAAPNTNSNYTLTLPAATGTVASIASVNNNGVVYANSSGQPTTGTAFVFDGTNVGIGTSSPVGKFNVSSANSVTATLINGGTKGVRFNIDATLTTLEGVDNTGFGSYQPLAFGGSELRFNSNGTTERMRIDSSGNLLVNTTTAQTGAKLAVTGGIQGTIQSGTAVASTSGTSINFTGIPSWVKRITVMFQGVSLSATANLLIQLGTGSTTYTTSGYTSISVVTEGPGNSVNSSTAGFVVLVNAAARIFSGHMVITNISGNNWISSHTGKITATTLPLYGAGDVSLGAVLTAVRITTNSTDTFDAGTINILYEG